ncbi:hypothetical protein BDK51DRAFT_33658 [Blyttiomyces helicus]|uniref:Uncharacterized protein n=1 Tax=Blyttiomyces helicus TaxID=388810 RepID=A0A4P9WPY1_9FUNG|nr:hypothetical protein BDK51DRAFT_33658 [Blyttiomyces helicus]|eukprot:RKO94612.1 hypothetical protein BDK51DRAFT_33658 [Blyttiomyces helicus]
MLWQAGAPPPDLRTDRLAPSTCLTRWRKQLPQALFWATLPQVSHPWLPSGRKWCCSCLPHYLSACVEQPRLERTGCRVKYHNHNSNYNQSHKQNTQDKVNPPSSCTEHVTHAEMAKEVEHGAIEAPGLSDHTKHLLYKSQASPPAKHHQRGFIFDTMECIIMTQQ